MNLKQQYPVSKECIDKGVRVPLGDATFILSYYNSSKAQLFFHSEVQKLKNSANATDAVLMAMRSTLVQFVILGWENLQEDDVIVEYSKEECERILNDYEGLDVTLMGLSIDVQVFKDKTNEEILGN